MVRGDPPGFDFENTWWHFLGGEVHLSETARLSLFYDRRESVIAGKEASADLILGYTQRISNSILLRSFVTIGASDTAEDYGIGLGLVFRPDSRRHRRNPPAP